MKNALDQELYILKHVRNYMQNIRRANQILNAKIEVFNTIRMIVDPNYRVSNHNFAQEVDPVHRLDTLIFTKEKELEAENAKRNASRENVPGPQETRERFWDRGSDSPSQDGPEPSNRETPPVRFPIREEF